MDIVHDYVGIQCGKINKNQFSGNVVNTYPKKEWKIRMYNNDFFRAILVSHNNRIVTIEIHQYVLSVMEILNCRIYILIHQNTLLSREIMQQYGIVVYNV